MTALLDKVVGLLEAQRFTEASEDALQAGVAQVLEASGLKYSREVPLTGRDRIDFLVVAGVGVECKVDGSLSDVTRQLHRYAQSELVHGLVLVTTRLRLAQVSRVFSGKPIAVVATMGGIF